MDSTLRTELRYLLDRFWDELAKRNSTGTGVLIEDFLLQELSQMPQPAREQLIAELVRTLPSALRAA